MTKPNKAPSSDTNELREKLADIEHQRWSDWQKWCHQVIRENVPRTDELEAVLARWDRQIDVPYELLTDSEKASDMEQVDRYWPLIEKYIATKEQEARIDILGQVKLIIGDEYDDMGWYEEFTEFLQLHQSQKGDV